MKIVTFSTLYPNAARPGHGIFVETRLRHLLESGRVEARVVAPVRVVPVGKSAVRPLCGASRARRARSSGTASTCCTRDI